LIKVTDETALDEIFMMGITPLSDNNENQQTQLEQNNDNNNNNEDEDKEICRVYFKLKEAMDNYRRDEGIHGMDLNLSGMDAFDCGSSPGG